jgi:predicted transcriptional regulator
MMENIDVRTTVISRGLRYYEIARFLGWSESKLSNMLRKPLTEDDRKLIEHAITQITSSKHRG